MPNLIATRYWIGALSLILLAASTPLIAANNIDTPLFVEQAQLALNRQIGRASCRERV